MRDFETVYVCNRCGETFSLDEGRTLHFEEGDFTACPHCGSDDIEEGKRCKICRTIHYEFDLDGGICKDCFQDAVDSYKACLRSLMGWEVEALESRYGTIDITEREE